MNLCKKCGNEPIENFDTGLGAICGAQERKEARFATREALKTTKTRVIRKVSVKRSNELKTYKMLRKGYLADHYYCQAKLEGCTHKAIDIHHTQPREGVGLNEISSFLAVCRNCHSILHDKLSAKERREKGLLK